MILIVVYLHGNLFYFSLVQLVFPDDFVGEERQKNDCLSVRTVGLFYHNGLHCIS